MTLNKVASRQAAKAPLCLLRAGALDLLAGVVQEPLQLLTRERPGLRAALVVVEMRDGVPLMTDRHRERTERILTRLRPAITGIGQVLAEQPQIGLVAGLRLS